MNLSLIVKGLVHVIGSAIGLAPSVGQPAPQATDVPALLAYKPTSQADAFNHLEKLHAALGTVDPADTQTIGKIFVAIGGLVEGFFPEYEQEGVFLIDVGNAIIQGKGNVGPIRVGNLGLTVTVAPWKS